MSGSTAESQELKDPEQIERLVREGSFEDAERLLRRQVADPQSPVNSATEIRLEILRRTRIDFCLTQADLLQQLRVAIPDVSEDDVRRWRDAGDLQARWIDGQWRYFHRTVSNLFRFSEEARRRRQGAPNGKPGFDLTSHLTELVRRSDASSSVQVSPIRHRVRHELQIEKGHPRWQPGALVRVWLPFPQEYRQQSAVALIASDPPPLQIAPNGSHHRTIYFQHIVGSDRMPQRFMAEYEFVTSAYCPKLDPEEVEPYDEQSEHYREHTSQRPPHIVFTPMVRQVKDQIVGDESNPLEKARKIFRWVAAHVSWCAEMEYSIIPNLSEKGLTARRGDCGVQGLTFITLCRCAGVPARWQSGWQTQPDDWNMHDWSEFYVEPWGWLPADASYGVRDHADPRVRDFLCGRMDPYRLIVNLDYGRELTPPKTSFRSEPNDFQRGEVEIDGHNLYFDEWDWTFQVTTNPAEEKK